MDESGSEAEKVATISLSPAHLSNYSTIDDVNRVLFCSGKHYYALDSFRRNRSITKTAIIRTEMLCPFPSGHLHEELSKFPNAKEFVWSQEEPANMGAWTFIEPRFRKQLGVNLTRVSRQAYGPSATGVAKVHQAEVEQLLHETFRVGQS